MSLDWELGVATFTEVVEGVIKVAVDQHGVGAGAPTFECISPLGLLSRPMDPVVGPDGTMSTGANCLFAREGGEGFAMPTNDPRWIAKIPQPTKGSTILYSAKAFLALDAENDAVTLLQPGEENDNVFSMNIKSGEEAIQIIHVSGSKITFKADGSVYIASSSGAAYIEIAGDAINLNGNVTVNGGMSVGGAGALAVLLGPLPGTPSLMFKAM